MINFTVTGDEAVIGMLRQIPPKIKVALTETMRREMITLLALAKAKVSGPVLKNRTGTLRRKLNYKVAIAANQYGASSIVGSVGLNLSYAAAHEYGIDKVVLVKAHERQMNMAFGRPVALPRKIEVAAHSMHMRLPERSYLRSSLREMSPRIIAALDRSVVEAVR